MLLLVIVAVPVHAMRRHRWPDIQSCPVTVTGGFSICACFFVCGWICVVPLLQCTIFCQPQLQQDLAALSPSDADDCGATQPSRNSRRFTYMDDESAGGVNTAAAASPAGPIDAENVQAATSTAAPPGSSLPLLPPAAAIAGGPANTLVATRSGRMLVCGDASSGQCGGAWVKARQGCGGFVDVGPELSWHGLTRPSAEEVAAAGGMVAQALPKVGVSLFFCQRHACVYMCVYACSTSLVAAAGGSMGASNAGMLPAFVSCSGIGKVQCMICH